MPPVYEPEVLPPVGASLAVLDDVRPEAPSSTPQALAEADRGSSAWALGAFLGGLGLFIYLYSQRKATP